MTGLLIPPGDVAALVGAIERLDGDRALLASMRENVKGVRLTSTEESVAAYRALYHEVVRPRGTISEARVPAGDAGEPVATLEDYARARGLDVPLPLVPVPCEKPRKG